MNHCVCVWYFDAIQMIKGCPHRNRLDITRQPETMGCLWNSVNDVVVVNFMLLPAAVYNVFFLSSCLYRSSVWSRINQPGGEAWRESQELGYADARIRGFLHGAGRPLLPSDFAFLTALRDSFGHQCPRSRRCCRLNQRVGQPCGRVEHKRGASCRWWQRPQEEQGSPPLSCLQSHSKLHLPTGST